MKQHVPPRQRAPRALATLACLLPALCGACSWVQALQDNFKMSFGPTRGPAPALPVTEVPVRMVYPDGISTLDEAVGYLLEPHAYRPADRNPPGERIAQRGFISNFDNDPVPLSMAMQRLMGADGQIILDQERKLYAFRPRHPDAPAIAFAALAAEPLMAAADATSWEQPAPPVPYPDANASPGTAVALRAEDPAPAAVEAPVAAEHGITSGDDQASCHSIRFRNRAMLSATVREYFLGCGFDEVLWRPGEPGRYADYRLLQDLEVPLPERYLDLIELLQARFGIRTRIHDNNRVEFHDENRAP